MLAQTTLPPHEPESHPHPLHLSSTGYSDRFLSRNLALISAQKHGQAPNCDVNCTADSTQKCGGWYSYQLYELYPTNSTRDFTANGFQAIQ